MDLVYRLPTRLSGPRGQVGLALSLPPPFRLSSSLSLCSSLCLQSSLCLAQFSSDSCLSGLVLFASLVRFTLAISDTATYRFPQELLHLVTISGRPPFSSSSCLHHSPQLGATSGRTTPHPTHLIPRSSDISRDLGRVLPCRLVLFVETRARRDDPAHGLHSQSRISH